MRFAEKLRPNKDVCTCYLWVYKTGGLQLSRTIPQGETTRYIFRVWHVFLAVVAPMMTFINYTIFVTLCAIVAMSMLVVLGTKEYTS